MNAIYTNEQLTALIILVLSRAASEADVAKQRQYYACARDATATIITGKNDSAGRVTQAMATLGIDLVDLVPATDSTNEVVQLRRERDEALELAGKNEQEANLLHEQLEAAKSSQVKMTGIAKALEDNGLTADKGKEMLAKFQPLLEKSLTEFDPKKLLAAIPAILDSLDLPTLVGNVVNAIKTGAEAVMVEIEAGDGKDEAKELELILSCVTKDQYFSKIKERNGGGIYNCTMLAKYDAVHSGRSSVH